MAAKKGWMKPSTLVIAGLGAAAIAGVYWFFSRQDFSSGPPPIETPEPTGLMPEKAGAVPPDLKGPRVRKGVEASTHTDITTPKKYPGMVYAKIKKTDSAGYRVFTPTVNGIFTRRLLSVKGKLWAEIKPA